MQYIGVTNIRRAGEGYRSSCWTFKLYGPLPILEGLSSVWRQPGLELVEAEACLLPGWTVVKTGMYWEYVPVVGWTEYFKTQAV